MRIIAHRGLFNGPDKSFENNPEQIKLALDNGFDCEIDLWVVDDRLYLGHDEPQYLVDADFLHNDKFWVHAKNFSALEWLRGQSNINYFWHDKDLYTLTSKQYVWTCETENINDNTIVVLLSKPDQIPKCFGVCSDYGILIKTKLGLK